MEGFLEDMFSGGFDLQHLHQLTSTIELSCVDLTFTAFALGSLTS